MGITVMTVSAMIAFATLALMLGVTLVQWKATGSGESDLA